MNSLITSYIVVPPNQSGGTILASREEYNTEDEARRANKDGGTVYEILSDKDGKIEQLFRLPRRKI